MLNISLLKKLLFLGKFLDKKVHGNSRRRELSNSVVRIHQGKKKTFVLLFMCHESIHFFNFKYTVC